MILKINALTLFIGVDRGLANFQSPQEVDRPNSFQTDDSRFDTIDSQKWVWYIWFHFEKSVGVGFGCGKKARGLKIGSHGCNRVLVLLPCLLIKLLVR